MDGKTLLLGFGLGVVATLILDPKRARRRSLPSRDNIVSGGHTGVGVGPTLYDVPNRAYAGIAMTRGQWSLEHVEDDRLVERVRAALNRTCSHPTVVDVDASDGEITLRGPILVSEHQAVVSAAAAVHGVDSVLDELEPRNRVE